MRIDAEGSPESLGSLHTRSLSPSEIMERARRRENALSRLLMAYISSGLTFMLLPGTFLGVWNLLKISGSESAASVSPSWLQAHGHAQVFGWIGSFILGIGFYSIPKLRGADSLNLSPAWACWILWTTGVALRWLANVYSWHWRLALPFSAAIEIVAFGIFFRMVSGHRPSGGGKGELEAWTKVVITASLGFMLVLAANLFACFYLALRGGTPALPHALDQRFLVLMAWGFLVPFVWGFSSKWMSVFLGLKAVRMRVLFAALFLNWAGILLTFFGRGASAAVSFILAACLSIAALRMFEPARQPSKTRGVHASFPFFVRMAYAWLLIASLLGMAAVLWDESGGIWGASRHALTVGFIAVMVLCVGQRVLPAFAGMRRLWSARLMFFSLAALTAGCTLRVSSEILAYQSYAGWAWAILPVSAIFELTGVTAFAMNILGTFLLEPSHASRQPVVAQISPAENTQASRI